LSIPFSLLEAYGNQEGPVNELDFILIFIIALGVFIGARRGVVRILVGILGIYITVVVAGYLYEPIGNTIARAFLRINIDMGFTEMQNFTYIVVVIAMTVAVELVSRNTFEETRIESIGVLDNVLGAVAGFFYGGLWASLFLVPAQYAVSRGGGPWSAALAESTLVPTLNNFFQHIVIDVVSIFFINGVPRLYRNRISVEGAQLLLECTSRWV
jgi:uncharacterized membrane protein required for colicin V production